MSQTISLPELERIIFEIVRGELPDVGESFTPQSNLVEAGLDSLTVVRLLLGVEERTGIWVDEAELTPENLASAEALARCVHQQRGQIA